MEKVEAAHAELHELCRSLQHFRDELKESAIYRSPIIDHFHTEDYAQRGVAGSSKFSSHAESERDFVQAILRSGVPPKDLNTNAPHILAVWAEALSAQWPLVAINQYLDCNDGSQVKMDIVADGGNEWIKVNTIREARLMSEFREQDSYVNSDYDSDSEAECSTAPRTGVSNSLIKQVEGIVDAAKRYSRPLGLPVPRVKYVLNRMEEHPEGGYRDDRIQQTFEAIRRLGVDLVFAPRPPPPTRTSRHRHLRPTHRIMLDLSVIVALCCDSTHHPLPRFEDELESRFRQRGDNGELAVHTNVSKDLRDQLNWEMEHPLVEEIMQRLEDFATQGVEVEWFVTQEVRERTPSIIDLIGGPNERARAQALFGDTGGDFWRGSRYEGKVGSFSNLKVSVLDDADGNSTEAKTAYTAFEQGLMAVCRRMLAATESPDDEATPQAYTASRMAKTAKGKKSRNPRKPNTYYPPPVRLPSAHTLRTMLVGVQRGMTVLTNNRGAVGKVIREMGVYEGIPDEDEGERAVVWVVNPSSLSEWRRLEVEKANAGLSVGGAKDSRTESRTHGAIS